MRMPQRAMSWHSRQISAHRAKSSAKLVVVGARGQDLGGGGELAGLDERLDDRELEEREVCHHGGERPAAELRPGDSHGSVRRRSA